MATSLIVNGFIVEGVGTFVTPDQAEALRLALHEDVQTAFVLVLVFAFHIV